MHFQLCLINQYFTNRNSELKTVRDSLSQIDSLSTEELFRTAASANMIVIAAASIVGAFYYQEIGNLLIIWIIAMLLISTTRILLSRFYFTDRKNNFKRFSQRKWQQLYVVSSLITGLLWALLIFYMPVDAHPVMISMLYIILASVMAGSITVLTAVLPAFYLYVTPIFLASFSFSYLLTSFK